MASKLTLWVVGPHDVSKSGKGDRDTANRGSREVRRLAIGCCSREWAIVPPEFGSPLILRAAGFLLGPNILFLSCCESDPAQGLIFVQAGFGQHLLNRVAA